MTDGPATPTQELHAAMVTAYEVLQTAASAVEFHRALAVLIDNAKLLPDAWLAEIAALAAVPWKRKKGRPALFERQERIEWECFHRHLGGLKSPMPSRAEAIAAIVRAHEAEGIALESDAAGKMYDAARNAYASRPYVVRLPRDGDPRKKLADLFPWKPVSPTI